MAATRAGFRRLADLADLLVDERAGLIQAVAEMPRQAGAPEFFHFGAAVSDTSAFAAQENFNAAGGASTDREVALAKAVGEAVERYSSALYELDELPLASFEEAGFACVDPETFALWSPGRHARGDLFYAPFRRDTRVRWTPARDLRSGEEVMAPAAMVHLPYAFHAGDAPIVQPISTGLACHVGEAEAAVSAVCEVVERDAFTLTWQAMLAHPRVDVETLSPANRRLVALLERAWANLTLLDATMDNGIPTVLAVLRSSSPAAPALVVAASSEPDPEAAVRKALEETAHTRRMMAYFKRTTPPLAPDPTWSNVRDQEAHLRLHAEHENLPLSDFLLASGRTVPFDALPDLSSPDPEEEVRVLVDRIHRTGHRVLLSDLTSPDVRPLGLRVARALVPGYHPLFMGHAIRADGGARLWEVPQRLGHRGVSRATGDNPVPHPFP